MMVSLGHYIALSAILFGIGMAGVIARRNALVIFMSVELMLNSANIAFAAFANHYLSHTGQVFVFIVMVVAACEVAAGLAIVLALFRNKPTVNVDEMNILKW